MRTSTSFASGDGRPRKRGLLTTRKREVFLTALRQGQRRNQAALLAGISPRTVEEWWQRGHGRLSGKPTYPEHIAFVHDVELAEAQAEADAVGAIKGAFRRDPRLAVWFLENRSPEWRARQQPVVMPTTTAPIQIASSTTQVIVTDLPAMRRIAIEKLGTIDAPTAADRAGLVEDTGG